MIDNKTEVQNQIAASQAAYEAPAIESVLTPDDLEREVAYAGIQAVSPGQSA